MGMLTFNQVHGFVKQLAVIHPSFPFKVRPANKLNRNAVSSHILATSREKSHKRI